MRILVTGGAGFIGSHLVDALMKKGHQVRIFDNLDLLTHKGGKLPEYFNKEAEFIKGDIRNKEALKTALGGVEIIFHLAAAISLGQSMYQIKKYTDVNIGGVANLWEILTTAKHKVRKIVFASSASVYGEGSYKCPAEGAIIYPEIRSERHIRKGIWETLCPNCLGELQPIPTSEEKPPSSRFLYGITKETGEKIFLSLGRAYEIPCTIFRYFNVYGPRQSWNNPHTAVFSAFLSRIRKDQPPVIVEDGLQTRDFIYVDDVVAATTKALENEKSDYEIINVGSGKPATILRVAEELICLNRKKIKPEITHVFRKGDVRHCFADIRKAKRILNWEPKVNFQIGARKMVEWATKEESSGGKGSPIKTMVKKGLAIHGKKIKH